MATLERNKMTNIREVKVKNELQEVECIVFKYLKKTSEEKSVFGYIRSFNSCFKGFVIGDYFYFRGHVLFWRVEIDKD